MLQRTSKFVLEVLPYLLTVLIAAGLVPGFLLSQPHGTKATAASQISYSQKVLETRLDNNGPADWATSSRP
jgi:hypothetical protein